MMPEATRQERPVLENTFDPGSPAEEAAFRTLAHRLDHLLSLREQPAWQEMPAAVRTALVEPIPWHGIGADAAYDHFRTRVLPYTNGNLHPRFFGWVQGNGTLLGMMADMLAAGLNPHMAGFNQAPALVEQQVIDWLAGLLGMPGASGTLVSGGSMASTLGLAVARFTKAREAGVNMRADGLQQWPDRPNPPDSCATGLPRRTAGRRRQSTFSDLGSVPFGRYR
jgi:aromatic-L-amino-acid/L-tryptophan decarboxylase